MVFFVVDLVAVVVLLFFFGGGNFHCFFSLMCSEVVTNTNTSYLDAMSSKTHSCKGLVFCSHKIQLYAVVTVVSW